MFDIVVPDLFFVSEARRHLVAEANVQGAPDLVVEVRSRSTARRDEGVKLRLYDRSGVTEYWVVDPRAEVVRVYRRGARGLARVAELARDQEARLTSPLLPGLSLPLPKVFTR
jgi:Uma2 family endonuclease